MNPEREAHRAAVDAGYASLSDYIKRWGGTPEIDPVEYYNPEPVEEKPVGHFIEYSIQWGIVFGLLALLAWSVFK